MERRVTMQPITNEKKEEKEEEKGEEKAGVTNRVYACMHVRM